MIVSKGEQKITYQKVIPYLVLILSPTELRDLEEILSNSKVHNNLLTNKDFRKNLEDFLSSATKHKEETLLEEGKVEITGKEDKI